MSRISIATLAFAALATITACGTASHTANAAQPQRPITTTTPAVNNLPLSKAIAGEWTITQAGSTRIQRDEDMPYLTFVPAEGRFYASNGCNILNGNYTIQGNTIRFNHVASTMKYCADVDFDALINQAINDETPVNGNLKQIGNETYLYITDRNGKALLTLTRHNMQFLNGNWRVASINGQKINDDEANIFFDIAELKVHGNTGCNYFNGSILIDPGAANSISFSGMGVTRMACYKGDQERQMLVALEEATTAVKGPKDTAILLDGSGKQVMILERAPIAGE